MKITCPYCKKVTTWRDNRWKPFCSERCKLIDLGRWASEEYRIAGDIQEKEKKKGNTERQEAS